MPTTRTTHLRKREAREEPQSAYENQDDADPFEPGTGCTLDGVPINCGIVAGIVNHGGANLSPVQTIVAVNGKLAIYDAGSDGFWVYQESDPADIEKVDDGTIRLGVSDVVYWKWVGVDPDQQAKEALGLTSLLRVGFQTGFGGFGGGSTSTVQQESG